MPRPLDQLLEEIDTSLKRLSHAREGSRLVAEGADSRLVEHIAKGGSYEPDDRRSLHESIRSGKGYTLASRFGEPQDAGEFMRALVGAVRGDGRAFAHMASKGWVEGGSGSTGGFLVAPAILPGYVEALRASAPLRARCHEVAVQSDEVWLVLEGDAVEVAATAEAATKLETTGTVAQKISTVFKVAGVTRVSDELLADTNGEAGRLIETQFGKQIGIALDTALISGAGVGEPTGILNAAGVHAQDVDDQDGAALYESVLKALSRIAQRFEPVDTVVVHPRDAVKFGLATTTTGEYLFPAGLGGVLPSGVDLVLDANLPTDLGTGSNHSVIIVGGFRRGLYFFSRQGLTVEASRDAGFVTDETLIRGLERYGAAVVVPGAFEVLTGITP